MVGDFLRPDDPKMTVFALVSGAAGGALRFTRLAMLLCALLAGTQAAVAQTGAPAATPPGTLVNEKTGEVVVVGSVPAPGKSGIASLKGKALGLARQTLRNALEQMGKSTHAIYDIPGVGAAARLAAMIASARIVRAGPVAGGRYEVVIAVKLPRRKTPPAPSLPRISYKEPDPSQVRAYPAPPPTGEEALLTPPDARGPFTGLIVDARGFDLATSMSPRLLDAALREVYSGAHKSLEFVEDVGVAGYMGSIAAALRLPRVGGNPLVVRAVGTGDDLATTVISLEDTRRFLNDRGAAAIIDRCAVCFVVDSLAERDR